jgi:hypothetical protein
MKKFAVITTTLTATLIFTSCSTYQRPESLESKIARFMPEKARINETPDIAVLDYSTKSRGRGPASVTGNDYTLKPQSKHTDKRLYFLSLYNQYSTLAAYSKVEAPQINVCPNFHTSVVSYSETHGYVKSGIQELNTSAYKDSAKWSDKYAAIYPELSLPVSKHNKYPRVVDVLKTEKYNKVKPTVQKAIDAHVSKIHDELVTLCENGSSDNYYTFANLNTYIKKQSSYKANKKNLKTLMTSPIFANMVLIDSIKTKTRSRGIASVTPNYSDEVIYRFNVPWIKGYMKHLKKQR